MENKKASRITQLKNSPLFAFTLANTELAHSNFWEWLINIECEQRRHPYVEIFIPDFYANDYKFVRITREEGHRDLSIYYTDGEKNCCHVVENKIKSIPTKEQLIGYSKALEKEYEFSGTLTGIVDTLEDKNGWEFLSYTKIASKIREIYDKNASPHVEVIAQYASDIEAISELLIDNMKTNQYTAMANKELEEIRLGDISLKLNGATTKKFFEKKIAESKSKLISKWGQPYVDLSFNNKKSTITIVYKQKEGGNEIGRLGVQLEGNQFRIYGGPSTSNSTLKDPKKLFEKFNKIGWMVEDIKNGIDEHGTTMKGGGSIKIGTKVPYCKYTTAQYTHIYQYWNIVDNSLEILWDDICGKLQDAKDLIDSEKISFNQ